MKKTKFLYGVKEKYKELLIQEVKVKLESRGETLDDYLKKKQVSKLTIDDIKELIGEKRSKILYKKAKNNIKRRNSVYAIAAALGIGTLGLTAAPAVVDKINKSNEFKKKYEVQSTMSSTAKESKDYASEVKALKFPDQVLRFIKNEYLEKREKITGDDALTTADIQIIRDTTQGYIYINNETGDYFTHGDNPGETEEKMKQAGISFSTAENREIIKILKNDGTVLDCVAYKNDEEGNQVPVKVTLPEQIGKPSLSILKEMGTAPKAALDLYFAEKGGLDLDSINTYEYRLIQALQEGVELGNSQTAILEEGLPEDKEDIELE